MPSIFIAIGSNIHPENNLKAAVTLLRDEHLAIRFSSVYRSAPLHHEGQDDFLNAVAAFDTDHSPDQIYDLISRVEKILKKNPPFRFGPRTIDLDLLLHGEFVLPDKETWQSTTPHPPSTRLGVNSTRNPQLTIPHPRMHERRFVLEPLTELLDPSLRHPIIGKSWKELLEQTMDQKVRKTGIQL